MELEGTTFIDDTVTTFLVETKDGKFAEVTACPPDVIRMKAERIMVEDEYYRYKTTT